MQVNVVAVQQLAREALPGLLEAGTGGALAEEMRGSGVRVMALCPRFTPRFLMRRATATVLGQRP